MTDLVHDLIFHSASRSPEAEALCGNGVRLSYGELTEQVRTAARNFIELGLERSGRVAVYLDKRPETVIALFAAAAAGGAMVPVNPLLKPEQVAHILSDSGARILVTSVERLHALAPVLERCRELCAVVALGATDAAPALPEKRLLPWNDLCRISMAEPHRTIDGDIAAILYTSGSTGKPKGVVLSHRNMVAGAKSVAQYLENTSTDRILAALPLSFDYGLNQLTTAFHVGACAVLMNYLLPNDIVKTVEEERITGLAAVPPLWNQLAQLRWPQDSTLRYLTNSGGAMPRPTLDALRRALPASRVYLMYGLTEAFRSTFLPPSELDRRPDSIGRAIPNAEIMVVKSDGTPCAPNEPGELVHRGALVALGYWNDAEKTAERFRPAPLQPKGLPQPEIAVWSGDTVRMDEKGFLYFIGRRDEMIKVSGYRVSPTEIEEVIVSLPGVNEVVALGVPHPSLGQAIVVAVQSDDRELTPKTIITEARRKLPAYMVPSHVEVRHDSLPRNPNGKFDRTLLKQSFDGLFDTGMPS